MVRVLGEFQDQVERRLIGRLLQRRGYGKWDYTSAEARFETMDTYIRRRHNMVVHYIAT